ncbi:MAG: B12-binding domain-containing radical SAM protein [Solirubrobacterales bacterium]
MKVLLIDPPFYRLIGFYNRYFPLGLATIGTVLRNAGHEVVVYDADYNESPRAMDYQRLPEHYQGYLASFREPNHLVWREVRRTVEQFQPELIGISIWTPYAASAFHIAAICKDVAPNCPIVAGGPHATVKSEEVLRICPAIDYAVRGEGEAAMLELAASSGCGLNAIEGLSFRSGAKIFHNSARLRLGDLDEIPIPDRTLLMNRQTYSSEDMGLMMTSRGCPYSCSFCATDSNHVRYRSIPYVIDEIKQVKAAWGTTQFSLKDDSFSVDKKRVEQFCDALEREGLNIAWECNTRVNLLTGELLARMKRAGCNSIKVGIESGSEQVLQRMNKRITLEQARKAATLLHKVGIHWTAYFLIGTPGESLEDIYRTLDFLYEIKPDFAAIGVYEPFPGTVMFEESVRLGLVKPSMTFDDFFRMPPNHYYRTEARRQVDTMDPEAFRAVEAEIKAKCHKYNKGLGRLLKRAKSRVGLYLAQPATLATDFKKYLSWS